MTPELKQQIENEAEYRASLQFHKKYSQDQWQACVITYRQGATQYANLWQAAEAKADRYEKALKTIFETTPTVSGANTMRFVARQALTPKTSSDDTE